MTKLTWGRTTGMPDRARAKNPGTKRSQLFFAISQPTLWPHAVITWSQIHAVVVQDYKHGRTAAFRQQWLIVAVAHIHQVSATKVRHTPCTQRKYQNTHKKNGRMVSLWCQRCCTTANSITTFNMDKKAAVLCCWKIPNKNNIRHEKKSTSRPLQLPLLTPCIYRKKIPTRTKLRATKLGNYLRICWLFLKYRHTHPLNSAASDFLFLTYGLCFLHEPIQNPWYARSKYHTQHAKTSFDEIRDLAAVVVFSYFRNISRTCRRQNRLESEYSSWVVYRKEQGSTGMSGVSTVEHDKARQDGRGQGTTAHGCGETSPGAHRQTGSRGFRWKWWGLPPARCSARWYPPRTTKNTKHIRPKGIYMCMYGQKVTWGCISLESRYNGGHCTDTFYISIYSCGVDRRNTSSRWSACKIWRFSGGAFHAGDRPRNLLFAGFASLLIRYSYNVP